MQNLAYDILTSIQAAQRDIYFSVFLYLQPLFPKQMDEAVVFY